jgi:hypothetical protein
MIDKHTLAIVNIIGGSFDMLGSPYRAYDLLGGKHGPVRLLTRMVTYSIFLGREPVGYPWRTNRFRVVPVDFLAIVVVAGC